MPKVTNEYIENKKSKIVEAAYNVCVRKTVSSVTMQDIIDESGLSQGGIYRFYSSLDDILIDLLFMIRSVPSIDDKVDDLFSRKPTVLEATKGIFDIILQHVKKHCFTYCKIDYEYNLFTTNYPDRAKKIYKSVGLSPIYDRLGIRYMELLNKEIQEGKIQPRVSIEELIQFLVVGYDGAIKRILYVSGFEKYIENNTNFSYKIDSIFHTLYLSTCYLLNIEE